MAQHPQNLITAMPFWDAKAKQSFRMSYCAGMEGIACLQVRALRLVNLVIETAGTAAPVSVYLVTQDGKSAMDITALVAFTATTVNAKNFAYHSPGSDVSPSAESPELAWDGDSWGISGDVLWDAFVCDGGFYYLEIAFAAETFWSELFQMYYFPEFAEVPDSDAYTRIHLEAANTCAIGRLEPLDVAQKLFINGRTSRPEYTLDESAGKDGNEEESVNWAKLKKRWKILFYAVESVADWCATLRLYDTYVLTDQYGTSGCSDIGVEITWPEDGNDCAALVEISFTRDVVLSTGCC